jgi:hypothetical protein
MLLLRLLWVCGQRVCVVQAKRYIHGIRHLESKMSYDRTITLGGLFDKGLELCREVLGAAYVDKAIQAIGDFMMAFQHITTEWCWGYAWTRPELDRNTAAC